MKTFIWIYSEGIDVTPVKTFIWIWWTHWLDSGKAIEGRHWFHSMTKVKILTRVDSSKVIALTLVDSYQSSRPVHESSSLNLWISRLHPWCHSIEKIRTGIDHTNIRFVTRLLQQHWYSHDITILLRPCVFNLSTTLFQQVVPSELLGTLRFTERQRDGNVLRQTVNWKEVNNYGCEQCIWIFEKRLSYCWRRQIKCFHVLY